MNINDNIHGFTVKSSEYISEVSATLYLMEHLKCGTRLAFLDREDTNKTFAIAFPTPPEDSTGVFHIIEHSVLCGSRKYPIKEPFVELLKGSLNTFLNAMTYEDRTVYPVSSRCDKDFLNLTDIYLDAVFHPTMLENPNIFRQEGWHYEYDRESDSLSYNGVVYNEMKGSYSSPDEAGDMKLSELLFGDSVYGQDSGGDPADIPSLSYESFKAAHQKYYHPSNAYIFLDGSIDLNTTLALISSYLNEYERSESPLPILKVAACSSAEATMTYEIPDGEEERPRARLLLGYVFSSFENRKELLATSIIADAVAGTNESPLKKAILDAGYAEDVSMFSSTASAQVITIEVRGIAEKNIEKVKALINDCLGRLVRDGLDRDRLSATLNRMEFKMREKDYGALPRGVAFALSVFGVWIYGENPSLALKYEDTVKELRAELSTSYYEDTLRKMTLDCPHKASLTMLPDKNAGAEYEASEKARLDSIRAGLSDAELEEIIRESDELEEWQRTDDPPEKKATIPTLALSDLSPEPDMIPTEISNFNNTETILHPIDTSGIMYINLYFNASGLTNEELTLLSLLCGLFTNLPTESYSPLALKNIIRSELGSFVIVPTEITKIGNEVSSSPIVSLSASALAEKIYRVPQILREVLLSTDFSDTEIIKKILIQQRAVTEDSIISSADALAIDRAEAAVSPRGALHEEMLGFEAYKRLKSYINDFDNNAVAFSKRLSDIAKRIFTKERLTVAITGKSTADLAESLVELFPETGNGAELTSFEPFGIRSEGIAIPTRVSFTALSARSKKASELLGALRVVRSILSYEYLWNNVRVSGGAYGTGFIARRTGEIGFYSYRDPSPEATLEVYRKAPEYLRALAASDEDLTKFIIGAIGEYDVLTTPRMAAVQATADYLTGWTYEHEQALRRQMLATDKALLLDVADLISEALTHSALCIAGSKDTLSSISEIRDNILEM